VPYVVKDRVAVTSTSTGTGNLALGSAASGYQSFSVIGEGNQTSYSITDGTDWEVGSGTYATGWSNQFRGTVNTVTDFLRTSDNALLNPETSDFVMEAWVYITSTTGNNQGINGKGTVGTNGYSFFVTNGLVLSFTWDGTGGTTITAGTLSLNTWAHVAVVRNSNVIRLYLNGVGAASSTACTTNITSTSNKFIGSERSPNPLVGYISNYRMTKGTLPSGYDATLSTLTVPTSPLTDISGTSILTCRTGVLEDISSNNLPISRFGLVTPNTLIPFTGLTPSLSRDQIYESSNSDSAVNWGSGTKNVIVSFLADNTIGSAPRVDETNISSDLTEWYNLKKQMDRGVVNSNPYDNNGTGGVVSTYSLVYTTTNSYAGGVLQPNGDVHFVPYAAVRGQKVSSSGVVSTYSLVYTAATAYYGGVLAPNGDVHFVPFNTDRGQKVSSTGVVSTYSLVHAPANAYLGGVLAPNGDIHFIPFSASVGQKVSAAGTVSTYSILTTVSSAYSGGVLSPNGDIHFIPYSTSVGQKISIAGVVSTYSLVYTVTAAYQGGVLAPNGDIYFIPFSANRGQKVSAAGVVSTYSLVYTTSNAYLGGVLTPDGEIIFVPRNAIRGQSISTGVETPIGYCLAPHFNKL